MMVWQRKRHPDDVPTPVAVALSDFCRRAEAPAPPAVVRQALSVLGDAQDARLRELTDRDPAATPLGPFAVIDMVAFGTAPTTAAQRQRSGYYELAQVALDAEPVPEDPDDAESPVPHAPTAPAPRRAKTKRRTAPEAHLTVAQKIAPKKRTGGAPTTQAPQQVFGTSFLPKRSLPAPRGRFTRIEPSRSSFATLLDPASRELLDALVDQVPHRYALLRSLEHGYHGRRGELSLPELDEALTRHGLQEALAKKERTAVLAAITEARGGVGRAAHALGLEPDEHRALVRALGLEKEVEQVRVRFTRDALAPGNLGFRLDLVNRGRYLADLGIERAFHEALTRDLTRLVDEVADACATFDELVDLLARQQAFHPAALRRALEAVGVADTFEPADADLED